MSAQTAAFNARPDPECGCAGKRLGFATRWETRTWLNDGTAVRIRPIRATDKRLELAFLNGLSRETRYQRLFSSRDLLPGELRRLTEIDYDNEMALIATIDRDGAPEQIGVARYVKTGKTTAELAIVVADCWQRHGVGTRLLEALVEHAGEAGIHTLDRNDDPERVAEAAL